MGGIFDSKRQGRLKYIYTKYLNKDVHFAYCMKCNTIIVKGLSKIYEK